MASSSIFMAIIHILQIVNVSTLLYGDAVFDVGFLTEARRWFRGAIRLSKDTEITDDKRNKNNRGKPPFEVEELSDIIDDFKMVLVVRNDLKMGKGKIVAQCSHATLGLYKQIQNRTPKYLYRCDMCGQVKVVVEIESEDDMLVLQVRVVISNHCSVLSGHLFV